MAQPLQIVDYDNAKVHVVEDDKVVKYPLARIEHLGRTVTLYVWEFVETGRKTDEDGNVTILGGWRWVRVDTLRNTTARAASGGHLELEGTSDNYRQMAVHPDEAHVTWRVWPGKGAEPEAIEAKEVIDA